MFSKIEVNGDGACDLYKYLRSAQLAEDGSEALPWNFTKFLVGRDGKAVARLAPQMTPEDIAKQLPELLQ